MLSGLLHLSLTGYIIATVVLTQITIACVTLFLHRCQTHQALKLHPMMSHFFRFWLWMTTGIVTREWVAIHRKHHAKCETAEDPHSPVNWGLKTMLLKGAVVYRAGKTKKTIETYGYGTPNDWIENHVYTKHEKLGIMLMLGIDLLLFGLPGLLIWLIQMAWIPFWAAGVINGVGHAFGYRNFETKDASTNIIPWAIIVGGEELHNNHHTFPTSAKLSVKWWEIDIGWLYIKILQFFGLAEVRRTLPLLSQNKTKSTIDFEVVKVLLHHKLQIMADYSRRVMMPALEKEGLPHHTKKLLTCSEYFLDDKKNQIISNVIGDSAFIRQVYQFKLSLQQIWEGKSTADELVNFLKKWVDDARQSGNILLEKFADAMPCYTLTN